MYHSIGAETFHTITEAVKDHLRYLARFGCAGASCSKNSLAILRSWDLQKICSDITQCRSCSLAVYRNRSVCGCGNPEAGVMFVGGVPESEDDHTGRPYSGPAGELLTRMISAMKLTRESVYITHAVRCCLPGGQSLSEETVGACRDLLYQEIEVINPRIICTLGDMAARILLGVSGRFSRIRGRLYKYKGIDVIPTYSPEYLLETPSAKREAWADLKQVMKVLNQSDRRADK